MAEGVFRERVERAGLADRIQIDSAGTHAYHVSDPPDIRAQNVTQGRGIDISKLRARKFELSDFEVFDYILVMDKYNHDVIMAACPKVFAYKVKFFLDYGSQLNIRNVPDPYYGGIHGFEKVLELVEEASEGLLVDLRKRDI